MKKLCGILIILAGLLCPLFSGESRKGLVVDGGVTVSYMTFFTYEDIAFRQAFNNKMGFGYEIGFRFMENYLFDPYLYYCPYVQWDSDWFYFGVGYFQNISFQNDDSNGFLIKTGGTILPFKLGDGEARINVGIEISETAYFDPYCKYPGSKIFNNFKASLVNAIKVSVGLNWFLPL